MTVLFVDLVGSTDMSTTMDPEDYREVIASYIEKVEGAVHNYDGHVANYLGDGVLVYFGYPKAHEEDSRRACLAALDMIDAVRSLNVQVPGREFKLAARVGIHTGTAVLGAVGEGSARERMAVGETLNLAARLQSAAEPNTVVISEATNRLVKRFLNTAHLGHRQLKGIPEPVDVYQVLGVRDDRTTTDASFDDLSPLVGRELELDILRRRWEESCLGTGRVVVLMGEAGLGKSRVLRALRTSMAPPFSWVHCRATPFFADTPLRPVGEALPTLLRERAEVAPADLAGFAEFLAERGFGAAEAAPLLGPLFGIAVTEEQVSELKLSPQIVRQRMLTLLVDLLVRLGHECPTTIVFEDVHWLDETSFELLDLLSERVASAPVLLVISGRPPFQPPLVIDSEISLRRLPPEHAETLMRNVAAGALTNDLVAVISERAEGNPLYLEELTRSVLEAGAPRSGGHPGGRGRSDAAAVPASLQELLMARLDRTAADRTVVQAASAIGRAFSFNVLREIVPVGDERLAAELESHIEHGLLSRRGIPPHVRYLFRHALLRDAVYESMTRRARQRYHHGISSVLKREAAAVPPEVMAYHCTEAGDAIEAAAYWNAAAQSALEAFALTEAMKHLHRGLSLIDNDDRPDAVLAEVRLRTTLGVPLMLTQGFASPAAGENYQRLMDRAEQAGDAATESLFPALWGMWTFYQVGGQFPRAQEMGERLLELGKRLDDRAVELAGQIGRGTARMVMGYLTEAREHYERGLAVYDRTAHAPLAKLFGQDGGAMCCSLITWVHAHAGEEELGRRRAEESLRMCDDLDEPATDGFVRAVLATFYCLVGDYEQGERHAREVIALAERQGMPHWAAQGTCNLGWALGGHGDYESAVRMVRAGLEGMTQIGTKAATSYFRAALVDAELRRGNIDGAIGAMADLREFVESSERYYEPVLWQLEAEIALARNGPDDDQRAREAFRRALDAAESQGAEGLARRVRERVTPILHGS